MSLLWFMTVALAGWSAQAQSTCPGYTASNLTATETGLTAQLTLRGPACDSFGLDLENLILLVEYQTGTSNEILSVSVLAKIL